MTIAAMLAHHIFIELVRHDALIATLICLAPVNTPLIQGIRAAHPLYQEAKIEAAEAIWPLRRQLLF